MTRDLAVTASALLALGLCLVAAPVAAQSVAFTVDTQASQVRVELGRAGLLKFLGHDHTIAAPLASGRIAADADTLARSSVQLRWDAMRLAVVPGTEPAKDVAEVEARMRGPEVLDGAAHVEIGFTSTSVSGRMASPGVYRLNVRGTLTLKGQPREIEIPLDVRVAGDALEASGSVELRLKDLGIAPPSVAGVVKVSNDFRVTFEIRARREAAGSAEQTKPGEETR